MDALLLAAALSGRSARAIAAALDELIELADALLPTAELALEALAQGAAFLRATVAAWPDREGRLAALSDREIAYPVAVGVAAAAHGLRLEPTLPAYLHAFAANLVSAGVRLIPLGRRTGRVVLARLTAVIEEIAAEALDGWARRPLQLRPDGRLVLDAPRDAIYEAFPLMTHGPLRVGIGGPVGSGKTALCEALCKRLRERYDMAVVTNDIYTKEDQEILVRSGALPAERIMGVETGGCPHTAIREDASINLAAVGEMGRRFPGLELLLIESGGDNLAATFSPELADLTIYVIDVAAGEKIPRKGGPGITRSDLLVINKIDLAPLVGASLEVMDRDAPAHARRRPFVFTNIKAGDGVRVVADFIIREGGLGMAAGAPRAGPLRP